MTIALLGGCTSTPPITKIGLIAPFEGLYRESGYAALAAMRAALDDCTPPGMAVVPLALDDSADPAKAARAAQKLLVDPAVTAVIGPFTPATIAAAQPVLEQERRLWIAPLLVDPSGGFVAPDATSWLDGLTATAKLNQAAGRIILVGLPATLAPTWKGDAGSIRVEDPADLAGLAEVVTPTDGVVWMGDPAQGAAWLHAQRAAGLAPAFFLANPVGGEVFAAHLAASDTAGAPVERDAHWLVWGRSDYNQRLATRAPDLPIAELTYAATCTALAQTTGAAVTPVPLLASPWRVQQRDLGADR